jgi:hypothetical protein
MFGVLATAAALCVHRALSGNWSQALALGYLTLISFNALWYGYAVAIKKQLTTGIKTTRDTLLFIIAAYGLVLIYLGIKYEQMLFVLFGILGFLPLVFMAVGLISKKPQPKFNWMREHYGNMIISGGAAYTAFLAFGARMFFQYPDNSFLGILPWMLPTLVALIGLNFYNRKYAKAA